MQKLHESQQKFEEATLVITRQSAIVDDLNSQLEKLKEVNGQLEYSWNQKYMEMVNVKDLDYNEACDDYKRQLSEQKNKYDSQIRELKKEFQHDIGVVDLELKRQTSTLREQVAKQENKLIKSAQ